MTILGGWSQSVTIDGKSARVRQMQIVEQAETRAARISFQLEALPDNAAAYDAAEVGVRIQVTQQADGETLVNDAEIRTVTEERGRTWTQKNIEARGLEVLAKGVRFQDSWESTAATSIVSEAWNRYGTGLGFSLNLDTNSAKLDLSSSYDSLFDLMEKVCRRTNWAWRIENGEVRFFDPLARSSPAIDQAAQQVQGGTLRVDRSLEQLVNKARTQGYVYRTKRIRIRTTVLECRWAYPAKELIPAEESEWELVGQPEIVEDYRPEDDRSVTLRYDDWLEFDPAIDPTVMESGITPIPSGNPGPESYADVVVRITHRRKVWFVKRDAFSVAQYGLREGAPLYGDGGQNEQESNQLLTEHLARWAYPTVSVDLQPLEFGHRPDSLCALKLQDPALSGTLFVTEVSRSVRGNELSVQLSLASPETVLD